MSNRSAEHSIQGFLYQFDKAIWEILNNGEATIEGIEDVDVKDIETGELTAIQCKYHSTKKYNPSEIKKPVIKFLEHFAKTKQPNTKAKVVDKYYLYAHFDSGHGDYTEFQGIQELKEFTETQKRDKNKTKVKPYEDLSLSDNDLQEFLDKVVIDINAKNLNEQQKEIVEKFNQEFGENKKLSKEEIEYYYNNAFKFIGNKSIQPNENDRKVTKQDFLDYIDKKVFLFNKWYALLRGKRSYINFQRYKLKKLNAIKPNKNKFLFIGKEILEKSNDEFELKDLVENLIQKYFKYGKSFHTSKVWNLILDCDEDKFKDYKQEFRGNNIEYYANDSDLDSFDHERFNKEPLTNSTANNRVSDAAFQIKLARFEDIASNKDKIKDQQTILFFSDKNYNDYVNTKTEKKKSKPQVFAFETNNLDLGDVNNIFDVVDSGDEYFNVINVAPNLIQIEVLNPAKFKQENESFSLGSYLKITDDAGVSIIGMLQSYKVKDNNNPLSDPSLPKKEPSFVLDVQPMGYMEDNIFRRGISQITIPPNAVEIADPQILRKIFSLDEEKEKGKVFSFGTLVNIEEEIKIQLDGNEFFNKHIAVVGSTGAGKSCTVAKILQEGIDKTKEQLQQSLETNNNARVIIFDLHGEYKSAFPTARTLTVKDFVLPYWLMNGKELEDFFLDAEGSDHNQRNLFKKSIIANKKLHQPQIQDITYDLPVYFSIDEVISYIDNQNNSKRDSKYNVKWKLNQADAQTENFTNEFTENEKQEYFFKYQLEPVGTSQTTLTGKFVNFLSRLDTKINDDRLDFLLKRAKDVKTDKLQEIISQFIGEKYKDLVKKDTENPQSNVMVIDLSEMAFEVRNTTISLVTRLIFNCAYYTKQTNEDEEINTPILLVYEEAHNYIPKTDREGYKSVKEAVERIAKEGRKYGVSAMIVSQRPSEISETIFSQCNTFVVMRLTNPTDQNYVKKLLPDSVSSITDSLSSFEQRETLVLGSSISMPTILEVDEVPEEVRPKSNDVKFIEQWRKDWQEIQLNKIVKEMTRTKKSPQLQRTF